MFTELSLVTCKQVVQVHFKGEQVSIIGLLMSELVGNHEYTEKHVVCGQPYCHKNGTACSKWPVTAGKSAKKLTPVSWQCDQKKLYGCS